MSNEKRIITLTDDTNKKELQESQSLKQIIFGVWLSLKHEDVSNYRDVEELVNKHRHFIYRKCLEFVLASPKIETIFSPSPDEGIFLLILFFKTSQSYFEVKIKGTRQRNKEKIPIIKELKLSLIEFIIYFLVLFQKIQILFLWTMTKQQTF